MNNCFAKNYYIERMKLKSGADRFRKDERQHPFKTAGLLKIIGTFLSLTPVNSTFIFSLIIKFLVSKLFTFCF